MLLFFVLIYLLFTVLIGVALARRVQTTQDFVAAGRSLPLVVNGSALFALWFGSETILGASGEFAQHGLIGIIEDPFGGVLCFVLLGLFFAKRLYRLNILTIPDLFRNKYGLAAERIASIMMVFSFFGYVAAQMVALGLIFQVVTGIALPVSILIGAGIVTVYTVAGGMWAVSVTDFIQSIMIILGLIFVTIFIVQYAGGLDVVWESIPPEHLQFFPDFNAKSITNWFSAWAVLGLGSIASQDLFQRVNAAKNEKVAVQSTYFAAGLYLLLAMLPLIIVTAAQVFYQGEDNFHNQALLPLIILNSMPLWLQVLFFGALISAILSTCSGAILAPASVLSKNLIEPLSSKPLSDRQLLYTTRISVILIAVISVIMSLWKADIYELVGESSVFGLVSLFIPMTAALYWKKANARGAIFSMITGSLVWGIFRFGFDTWYDALIPGTIAGLIAMIAGSLLFNDKANS